MKAIIKDMKLKVKDDGNIYIHIQTNKQDLVLEQSLHEFVTFIQWAIKFLKEIGVYL